MDIRIDLTKTPKIKPADQTQLGFGKIFGRLCVVMDFAVCHVNHSLRFYLPFRFYHTSVVVSIGFRKTVCFFQAIVTFLKEQRHREISLHDADACVNHVPAGGKITISC